MTRIFIHLIYFIYYRSFDIKIFLIYKVPLLRFKYFFFTRVSGDKIKIKIKSVIA